jgi:hypothetical protein
MQSKAATVKEYLASLPTDRRQALEAVRKVIRANLDGYEEGMQYGMIGFFVPHKTYPPGYHCNPKEPLPFAGLASQKGHMSLYCMGLYVHGEEGELVRWFRAAWAKAGKKLDMGKACIRFKSVDDLALDVLGESIRRLPAKEYIAQYEAQLATTKQGAKLLAARAKTEKVKVTSTPAKTKAGKPARAPKAKSAKS